MYIKLTSVEQGVTEYIKADTIEIMKFVDPKSLKSDMLILPNAEKDTVTIVVTRNGNKSVVKESPEQIIQLIKKV